MTLKVIDGFDLYTSQNDVCFPYGNSCSFGITGGRFGSGAMEIGHFNQTAVAVIPSNSEFWLGYAINMEETPVAPNVLVVSQINSPLGVECMLSYSAAGLWTVQRGNGGTTLGTGTKLAAVTTWHWLEIHFVLSGTVGVFELWVDGVQVINITGANTAGASGSVINNYTFGGANNAIRHFIDDFYMLDTAGSVNNTRLGDGRIETLAPITDAGPNDGTLTSGSSHFAMVDEDQNDGLTTTTTLTNTSGQEELFGMTGLGGTVTTVHAVKVSAVVEKSNAGACSLQTVVNSVGSVATGTSTPLTTSFEVVGDIYELDPHTSAAWTLVSISFMECGCKIP